MIELPGDLTTLIKLFATRLGGHLCVRKQSLKQMKVDYLQRTI